MATIKKIAAQLERWIPKATAESYDNVGLLLGRPDREITRGLVALDLTPAVVNEAIELGVELIVTHHPPIFRPLQSMVSTDFVGSMLLTLAEQGIAVYAAHTNLDSAHGGVSFELAERIGLGSVRFLTPSSDAVVKLVTFVPNDAVDFVRDALTSVGAGTIGQYEGCSFAVPGTGSFIPGEGSNPTIGSVGSRENVDETRLEMDVETVRLGGVITELKRVHPYEEVAYDVFRSEKDSTHTGMGAIGELEQEHSLFELLDRIRVALNCESLRFTGSSDQGIRRVAVCGGSGGDLIADALAAGADAYVTADLSYHRFFEVLKPDGLTSMALVDAGHYETEAFAEELLVQRLVEAVPDVHWEPTGYRTSPIGHYP